MNKVLLHNDDPLEKVGLPTRGLNALLAMGVNTVEDWLLIDDSTLFTESQLAWGTFRVLLAMKYDILTDSGEYSLTDNHFSPDLIFWDGKCWYDLPFAKLECFGKLEKRLYESGYFMLSDVIDFTELSILPDVDVTTTLRNQLIKLLESGEIEQELIPFEGEVDMTDYQAELLCPVVLKVLDESGPFGVERDRLIAQLPDEYTESPVAETSVDLLLQTGEVVKENGLLRHCHRPLRDTLEEHAGDRIFDVIEQRLKGRTLEEIGQEMAISRERVRQIEKKAHEKLPDVDERRYLSLLNDYDFSEEAFCEIMEEPPSIYRFLEQERDMKTDKKSVDDFLEDEHYPVFIREKASQYLYRNYVLVDGARLPANRPSLVRYAVRKYCENQISFDELKRHYAEMIDQINRENGTELESELNRTVEASLSTKAKYNLWMPKKMIRYYDFDAWDYTELVEFLDISRYRDKEITTQKLFLEFPTLMQKYDIRDHYELHVVMKKIWNEYGDCSVEFGRNPTLKIGNCDRDAQVKQLLFQLAPISVDEYCAAYEELYGASAATVQGSYLDCLDLYFHDKMFTIDADVFTADQFDLMKKALDQDYYTMSDVESIFHELFPAASNEKINSYNLKSLGFRVFHGHIVSSRYDSFKDYVRTLLTASDYLDETSLPKSLRTNGDYLATLYELMHQGELFEYEKDQFVLKNALEELGVSKEKIDAFRKTVKEYVPDGMFFTIKSLEKSGFHERIEGCPFGDWFYASLLAEEKEVYTAIHVGYSRLFRRGTERFGYKEFLRWILSVEQNISLDGLTSLLEEDYGLRIRKDKLLYVIQDAGLFYDKVTKRVSYL